MSRENLNRLKEAQARCKEDLKAAMEMDVQLAKLEDLIYNESSAYPYNNDGAAYRTRALKVTRETFNNECKALIKAIDEYEDQIHRASNVQSSTITKENNNAKT